MLKKRLTILTCAVVIAIGGMGTLTTAMALDDPCSNFNIQLLGVERDHGDVFVYKYSVSGGDLDISKISSFGYGIDGQLAATETNFISVFEPGAGLPSDKWLEGIPQLQAIGITAQSYTETDPLSLYVSGTGGNVGTVSAHTIAGNKIETCFIEGPVTGLPVDATVPSVKIVNLNGDDYCIDMDPRTGCPVSPVNVYECANPSNVLSQDLNFVVGSNSSEDPEGPTTPTFIGDVNSDMRCPVGKAAHNPCQWVLLAGGAYGPICW